MVTRASPSTSTQKKSPASPSRTISVAAGTRSQAPTRTTSHSSGSEKRRKNSMARNAANLSASPKVLRRARPVLSASISASANSSPLW